MNDGQITSSPAPIPIASSESTSASVPLATPIACGSVEVGGGLALERLDLGAEDEAARLEDLGETLLELRDEWRVLRLDVDERNHDIRVYRDGQSFTRTREASLRRRAVERDHAVDVVAPGRGSARAPCTPPIPQREAGPALTTGAITAHPRRSGGRARGRGRARGAASAVAAIRPRPRASDDVAARRLVSRRSPAPCSRTVPKRIDDIRCRPADVAGDEPDPLRRRAFQARIASTTGCLVARRVPDPRSVGPGQRLALDHEAVS